MRREVRLCIKLNQARFKRGFHAVKRGGFLPPVTLFPALHCRALDLQRVGDLWHGKPLPEQQARLSSWVVQKGEVSRNGHGCLVSVNTGQG